VERAFQTALQQGGDGGLAWDDFRICVRAFREFLSANAAVHHDAVVALRIYSAKTDVFSLGVTLFEAFAGAPLFVRESKPLREEREAGLGWLERETLVGGGKSGEHEELLQVFDTVIQQERFHDYVYPDGGVLRSFLGIWFGGLRDVF
jgi:hypothetical protein